MFYQRLGHLLAPSDWHIKSAITSGKHFIKHEKKEKDCLEMCTSSGTLNFILIKLEKKINYYQQGSI